MLFVHNKSQYVAHQALILYLNYPSLNKRLFSMTINTARFIGTLVWALFISQQVLAADAPIVINAYTEKGFAGKQTIKKLDDNSYEGKLLLEWNNRRVEINEKVQVNSQGIPTNFEATGISAFGAPIDEKFTLSDGVGTWEGLRDEGQIQFLGTKFYTPADEAGVTSDLLVKALLSSPTGKIDLLPSGSASLVKLKALTIKNGDQSEVVNLYAIVGLGLNPDFSWYDSKGNFFAKDYSGFLRFIRDGFSLENFDYLAGIQKQAEQDYMEGLAGKLSHKFSRLLIKNVNVVDVENSTTLPNIDVLIEDGVITRVDKNITHDSTEFVVNGKGKTLIPGLWDMHGHLSKDQGILNIATGVTSVRDMGNDHDNIMEIERLFHQNKIIGNQVYRAGFMDQFSEYSAGLSVKSLEEAHEKVDWFADNGYLQIKLYSSINPKWVKPISDHAHRRGLRVSGHIPAFMTAEQAIKAGYDEIQHVNMLFLNFLAGTKVDTRQQLRFSLIGEQAKDLKLDSQEVTDFIKLLADNQIVVDPTVSTFRSLLLKKNKQIDPEFADVAEHFPPSLVRQLMGAEMNVAANMLDSYQQGADALMKMVKAIYDAGVPIMPGTDNLAGFTLLRELDLYAKAGIPAIEVLKIATIKPAKLMGVAHQTGSITAGKKAEIVLLDRNPLESMDNLLSASMVIKGNHFYLPEALFESLGVTPFVKAVKVESNKPK